MEVGERYASSVAQDLQNFLSHAPLLSREATGRCSPTKQGNKPRQRQTWNLVSRGYNIERKEKGVSRIVVKGDFRFHYAGLAADLGNNQDGGGKARH